MGWHAGTDNIIESRSNVIKEDPGILKSSVNITVDKKSIGTHVNCTISCDFIETTISAAYIVDAHCKSFYYFFYLNEDLVIVKLVLMYSYVIIQWINRV